MIRLGLRLALTGGRATAGGLAFIGVAVALGVGLLLTTLAGTNAVHAQNQRYAWLNTGAVAAADDGPLWWLLREDYFHGQSLGRVEVAAARADAPVPPGLPRLPGPGEVYASPALAEALRTTPAAELGDRFPGRLVGTIGAEALPAPNSLLAVVGRTPAELSALPGAVRVSAINTVDPDRCDGCFIGIGAAALNLVLSVVAAALLFPVLVFIGTATRLAAARRDQRFAAMRLVGATPRQVSVLSAVESAVAAVAGTAAGFVLFLVFRDALAAIPFTGAPFFPADLSLGAGDVALVALGVPAASVLVARLALRRVRITPLGVSRRVTPRPPRAWRVVPLAAGIAELAYFVGRRPASTDGQTVAYLSGILLVMVGLVVAGPWLTLLGSRVMARRASRPAALIAGRRLSDDPKAGFRMVSGVMLALFVTSVATGVITTIVANRGAPRGVDAAVSALSKTFWPEERPPGTPAPTAADLPTGLRSIPGVTGVQLVRESPLDVSGPDGFYAGVIACADLAGTPSLGRCAAGARVAAVFPDLIPTGRTDDPTVWPGTALSPADLERLPVVSVVVATDGSSAAIERARTQLEVAFPAGRAPRTFAEWEGDFARSLVQFQRLADVAILASLPIAGCSLAVGVAGGLSDRRRPFSMLRLTGMRIAVLRRVVALETVVPLLVVAVVAAGTGFLAAHLFLVSQMGYTLTPPPGGYYVAVAAGLAASLGIIASTLPLLRRITGPEAARNG